MPSTVQQVIAEALVWVKREAVTLNVSRPDMKLLLWEAFQSVYVQAVNDDPSFFMTTEAFVSSATPALPTTLRDLILVEITDAACLAGAAREAKPNNYFKVNGVDIIQGTAADPLFKLNETTLTLAPAYAGTYYFIPKYGESDLSTESFDLETILPRPYIQMLVLRMVELARIRFLRDIQVGPTNLQQRLDRMQKSARLLKAAEKPLNLIDTDTQAPRQLQATAQQGSLYRPEDVQGR